ncbi:unnamed protein product [Schistocephalus solidus]|uniref:WD_REPEATS_REGION domain-containing protein n=1 Tax=Schistocephalus solidus TaxID=70667 RepID=A0A183SRD8_SCHSO|nr:unnamed protein product [Schistocephalus solidus]
MSRSVCCINSGRDIYIYPVSEYQVYESYATPSKRSFKTSLPVSHDFSVSSLLLIGLSGGEIHILDPFQKETGKVFNEEKQIERSAVTCIRWVPYSTNHFLVAHASGHMYIYNEQLPCCVNLPTYQQFKKGSGFVIYTCKTKSTCNPMYNWSLTDFGFTSSPESSKLSNPHPPQNKMPDDFDVSSALLSPINQFAFSTCGKYLAVVTEDGYMRVFDYHRMDIYGYMRSYFGGLTCVDWSPDGKFVVVGGQDDLITIWSFTSQAVICRGQGHKSWINVVRFDPFVYPTKMQQDYCQKQATGEQSCLNSKALANGCLNTIDATQTTGNAAFRAYRLGSVGQDTLLCLWELTEDIIRQGIRFSATTAAARDIPSSLNNCLVLNDFGPGCRTLPSSSTGLCEESIQFGGKKSPLVLPSASLVSSTMPRSKRKPFNFLLSYRPTSKPAGHFLPVVTTVPTAVENLVESGKSSTLTDSGVSFSGNTCLTSDLRSGALHNHVQLSYISTRDLLGTPNCPTLSDVPMLEPFAKFGITRDLVTDMVFREDSVNLALQQGVVLTFSRPMDSQVSEACSYDHGGSNGYEVGDGTPAAQTYPDYSPTLPFHSSSLPCQQTDKSSCCSAGSDHAIPLQLLSNGSPAAVGPSANRPYLPSMLHQAWPAIAPISSSGSPASFLPTSQRGAVSGYSLTSKLTAFHESIGCDSPNRDS